MHLLFECETDSEPLWTLTEKEIQLPSELRRVGRKTITLDCTLSWYFIISLLVYPPYIAK
jgi:hypothetical protein